MHRLGTCVWRPLRLALGLCWAVAGMGMMGSHLLAQKLDTLHGKATAGGLTIPYSVLAKIPEGTPEGQVPVILFLHGAGERGSDDSLQLTVGLPSLVKSLEAEDVPCYIIMAPQCPVGMRWVETDWTLPSHKMLPEMGKALSAAMAGFEEMVDGDFRIDRSRMYLTGISMGGFGTWELLQRGKWPFAAAIPICGGGDPAHVDKLLETPIWAFHGQKDKLVKVDRTLAMVKAITGQGGATKVTIYETLGHLCWNTVYQDAAVVRWLMAQDLDD